jgi:hypothetical protein
MKLTTAISELTKNGICNIKSLTKEQKLTLVGYIIEDIVDDGSGDMFYNLLKQADKKGFLKESIIEFFTDCSSEGFVGASIYLGTSFINIFINYFDDIITDEFNEQTLMETDHAIN